MIHAYDEDILRYAQNMLGNSLDYAVNVLAIEASIYYPLFVKCDIATKFEKGDPFVVMGQSGIELTLSVLSKYNIEYTEEDNNILTLEKSPEYWAGWAIAFYQWYTACSLNNLNNQISIDQIIRMYDKYHEMDIMHFVERIDSIRTEQRLEIYLKELRKARGYSQKELAEKSGIPLKTLQHYEQGTKSLRKANAEYVISLSRILQCRPEELLA